MNDVRLHYVRDNLRIISLAVCVATLPCMGLAALLHVVGLGAFRPLYQACTVTVAAMLVVGHYRTLARAGGINLDPSQSSAETDRSA